MRKLLIREKLSRVWNSLPASEFVKKMIEIYSVSFTSSALFTSFFVLGIVTQNYWGCLFCSAICLTINVIWLAYRIKRAMQAGQTAEDCRILYLKVYSLLAGVNIVMSFFDMEPIYTWLFLPYKLFGFEVLPRVVSAIIINVFMVVACLILPNVPRWFKQLRMKERKPRVRMRKLRGGSRRTINRKSNMRSIRVSKKR